MKSLFVADPFDGLDPCHDSTIAMIEASQERGHEIWGCTGRDLGIDPEGATAYCRPIAVMAASLHDGQWSAPPDWLDMGEPTRLALREFDVISVRTDPPVDDSYLRATYILDHVDPNRTTVVNRPSGLRNANEKLYALHFRSLMPDCVVSARREDLIAFAQDVGTAVAKPTHGMAGRGILLLRNGDPNMASIIDSLTNRGRDQVMLQRYVADVEVGGDRRVIVIDGKPVGAITRMAAPGDFRCNMAAGGSVRPDTIDDDVKRIASAMAERLRADGLWFVGLDVIGGTLSEVNVTSPTGLREIQALTGVDVAAQYAAFVECLADRR